jgi:putative ABC transport system substrate-binding protein
VKRRAFITLLGGATVPLVTPSLLAAQEARTYRIGFLTGAPREAAHHIAFFDELRMSGFIDGQNLAVIAGGFGIRNEQVSAAATAIVQSAPDAIVSAGPVSTRGTGGDENDPNTRLVRRHGWRRVGAITAASGRQYHGCQPARA